MEVDDKSIQESHSNPSEDFRRLGKADLQKLYMRLQSMGIIVSSMFRVWVDEQSCLRFIWVISWLLPLVRLAYPVLCCPTILMIVQSIVCFSLESDLDH